MTGIVTLTAAGIDTGPFYLYSNVDGFNVPFERNIPRVSLVAPAQLVVDTIPLGTTIVRVRSYNETCSDYVDIELPPTLLALNFPGNSQYLNTILIGKS